MGAKSRELKETRRNPPKELIDNKLKQESSVSSTHLASQRCFRPNASTMCVWVAMFEAEREGRWVFGEQALKIN